MLKPPQPRISNSDVQSYTHCSNSNMFAILWQTFCCVRLIILENFYGQLRLWGICPTDIFPSSRSSDMERSYGITFTFYYEQHPPSLPFRNICAVFQFQKMDCVRRFGVWNIGKILWWHAGTNTESVLLTDQYWPILVPILTKLLQLREMASLFRTQAVMIAINLRNTL